jgi:hypothetical protein
MDDPDCSKFCPFFAQASRYAPEMLSDGVAAAIARFFDAGRGPSHDELSRMFRRADLEDADPVRKFPGETFGKMKRVREVLSTALDTNPAAGERLTSILLGAIKASGGFRPQADSYAGTEVVEAAREAFRAEGYDLDPEGNLRPALLDGLAGAEATDALAAYVRRANVGSADAALVLGTGKDLLEATARHLLVERNGAYPETGNFPATLFQAYDRLQLATPGPDALEALSRDAREAVQQALWLLGLCG